jgi:hypothetical protein
MTMNDRFQSEPPRRSGAPDPDFEDGPNLSVSRPRQGVPVWVWLLIGIPVVFAVVCGGLSAVAGLLLVARSEPSGVPEPPEIEIVADPEAP